MSYQSIHHKNQNNHQNQNNNNKLNGQNVFAKHSRVNIRKFARPHHIHNNNHNNNNDKDKKLELKIGSNKPIQKQLKPPQQRIPYRPPITSKLKNLTRNKQKQREKRLKSVYLQ